MNITKYTLKELNKSLRKTLTDASWIVYDSMGFLY